MTTITCSSNCVHQKDGLCTLDNITVNTAPVTSDCVFFEEKASGQNVVSLPAS